jgi:hypothetical protein
MIRVRTFSTKMCVVEKELRCRALSTMTGLSTLKRGNGTAESVN